MLTYTTNIRIRSDTSKIFRSAIRTAAEMPFANRRCRCKKLGKKVPQAYRVYVEDTFLPCDAADVRIFAKEPEFFVFYNGKEEYSDNSVLKLSDAFTQKQKEYALELSVKVININYDKESQILKSCKPLGQYSLFVDTVRRHIAIDREYGFEKAIKECIQHDILRDYLQRKSKEVLNMLIGEYDYDTDIAVQREESFEIGLAEGEARGKSIGLAEGEARGEARGSRQKALETAKNLLRFGLSVENIAQATGLTREEVEAIK